MEESNLCSGTWPLEAADFLTCSNSSVMPLFFRAEIIMTGQPSFLESLSVSILSPFFSTKSAMLRATTTGRPVSIT